MSVSLKKANAFAVATFEKPLDQLSAAQMRAVATGLKVSEDDVLALRDKLVARGAVATETAGARSKKLRDAGAVHDATHGKRDVKTSGLGTRLAVVAPNVAPNVAADGPPKRATFAQIQRWIDEARFVAKQTVVETVPGRLFDTPSHNGGPDAEIRLGWSRQMASLGGAARISVTIDGYAELLDIGHDGSFGLSDLKAKAKQFNASIASGWIDDRGNAHLVNVERASKSASLLEGKEVVVPMPIVRPTAAVAHTKTPAVERASFEDVKRWAEERREARNIAIPERAVEVWGGALGDVSLFMSMMQNSNGVMAPYVGVRGMHPTLGSESNYFEVKPDGSFEMPFSGKGFLDAQGHVYFSELSLRGSGYPPQARAAPRDDQEWRARILHTGEQRQSWSTKLKSGFVVEVPLGAP